VNWQNKDWKLHLNYCVCDQLVDSIITFSGDYGSPRILPMLEMDMTQANPKVLMGCRDITSLLNGIHQKTGLVAFHEPICAQTFTSYTLTEFKKVF